MEHKPEELMTTSLGRVVAQLAEPSEVLPPKLVDLINQNVQPPAELSPEDVFVRAMYVISDQVNSFGGRFPADEHEHLTRLLVDSPVLIGHRKDKLPVGRNFHAETVERDGRPWVKSYFYWLRSADDAEQLRDNIDGGIYKECSVAFTFRLPECSLCGKDIRRCEHEPLAEYERDGAPEKCYFNYRRIERVLETSLVYRGAAPETSLSKELATLPEVKDGARSKRVGRALETIRDLSLLESDRKYLLVPRYDGLSLTARVSDGELLLARLDGTPIPHQLANDYQPRTFQSSEPIYGILVGYRGRERCSFQQLERHLVDGTGLVSRLVLHLFPNQGVLSLPRVAAGSKLGVRLIPHRVTSVAELDRQAREIMTRDGVEIWPSEVPGEFAGRSTGCGFCYCPPTPAAPDSDCYLLRMSSDGQRAELILTGSTGGAITPGRQGRALAIIDLDIDRLHRGRRFVAYPVNSAYDPDHRDCDHARRGRLVRMTRHDRGLVFKSAGALAGRFALRPIRLGGRDGYLFYRLPGRQIGQGEVTDV